VLTIHNLAYQGVFPRRQCADLGLLVDDPELAFHGNLSFLRAGIAHADVCTTVSHSYARQITGPTYGCGLEALLARKARQGRLHGIVNGIDASWSSVNDPALVERFQPGDWQRRQQNKLAIQHSCNLRPGHGPLFGIVSRLVHQKGIDLVCAAIPQIVAAGGQLVVMGHGEPEFEQAVREMQLRFPDDVAGPLPFDEAASRVIFAGADFLLMPSRFEPCGLSQMYAQAYGCLPIAHATGGLQDTIDDGVTGLLFPHASAMSMRHALQRAFRLHQQTALLDSMRLAAMLEPRNWQGPARQYAALYDSTLQMQIAA
jgi:starch synthase